MKYQVLARKYRPGSFSTMMGQEHVLKALTNALDSERLHHAYLFTGTRGVGKTTVARILAKALNCEQGISASPCGECDTCKEIEQGRFIDLIEVDAASKTKVEDTRELLDNVQYAPTRGRFKIYLIDEVHMLSVHSFNALLKTLEEPPPHAKFLLATTDPQKLPVTVLSRCLQFNLKSLTIEQIEQQLEKVLGAEQIPFENNILKPLAIAADGSMRDALSLLDQAIAYSDGKPNLADIEVMLGSVQKERIFDLLNALGNADGRQLVQQSRILTGQGIDVNTILAELLNTLQRIALCQMVPDIIDDSLGDKTGIEHIAQQISVEDIQLYYQIALNGRKDLPFSPQPQGGFEMILLRMLAFRPDAAAGNSNEQKKRSQPEKKILPEVIKNTITTTTTPAMPPVEKKSILSETNKLTKTNTIKQQNNNSISDDYELPPIDAYEQDNFTEVSEAPPIMPDYSTIQPLAKKKPLAVKEPLAVIKRNSSKWPVTKKEQKPLANRKPVLIDSLPAEGSMPAEDFIPAEGSCSLLAKGSANGSNELANYWHDLIKRSKLKGLEQQLAKHCALASKIEQNGEVIFELLLQIVHKHLLNDKIKSRLVTTLQKTLNSPLKISIADCQKQTAKLLDTPRRREIHDAEVLQQQAEESIINNPGVQMIINAFSAIVRKETIKPI